MANNNIDWDNEVEVRNNTDFIRFFRKVSSSWYWFLIFGLLGVSASFVFLRYSIPKYKVHAKLLVSDEKKGGGMAASSPLGDLSGLMGAKNSVDNEVEVLKTADLMREMVLAEEAFISYYKAGSIVNVPQITIPFELKLLSHPDSILEAFSADAILIGNNQLQLDNKDTTFNVAFGKPFFIPSVGSVQVNKLTQPALKNEKFGFTVIPVRHVVDGFTNSFNVEVTNKLVSTINLTLESKLPKLGEQYLNTLIDKYVERNLHDKNVIADSTLSFINTRLKSITDELAGVEDKISGYKQETKLADISQQSRILLETSADYSKNLAEAENQLAMLDAMAVYLQDTRNPRVVPSAVMPQDIAFNALISRYNELVLQRERLLLANTENNPLVQSVSNQIANVRQDMIQNVATTRKSLQLSRSNQARLSKGVTSQIQRVPTIERGYIDLARLQQIKQAQYIYLQEKWEETAISRTANVSNSKIIDTPKAEELPFSPKRKMIIALGLFIGLAIPLLIIYIKDLLNVRVQEISDIQLYTKLPILGAISHSDEKEQVIINKSSRSPIAEQFRAMRTNLEFAINGGKTILFTSSMSGEGKSYVALNMAVSLALLDKKVLLMELDLRKPSITSKLGLPAGKGFSHYVVRPDMRADEIIMPSGAHENVDLIQAGAIPPNPAELLVHPRTLALMTEMSQRYDYVLIDAPPVGMVTDAQLLVRYTDICLYLIRQRYTYKEQLRIPNDLVSTDKMKHIQLIVNDVKNRKGGYGEYGYGYGFGYGYGYGDYVDKGPVRRFFNIRRK